VYSGAGKPTQTFYVRSEETGEKVMWTRYESHQSKWYFKILNEEAHKNLTDWRLELSFSEF
jgi:hypothetical protein